MYRLIILTVSSIFFISCSSVNSIESPESPNADGLTYYMPKKDILITVTVEKQKDDNKTTEVESENKITKVTIGMISAYPDMSKQYVLQYNKNLFGKNTLNIGIGENGLLKSSKSKTVSQVSEVLTNLAKSSGFIGATKGVLQTPLPKRCDSVGNYTFIYAVPEVKDTKDPCGLNVKIVKIFDVKDSDISGHAKIESESHSGIFYKQNEPYRVKISGQGLNIESIVFSPSNAKTLFLPVSKTLFSNNEANFEFVDGVPTKYVQDTEGEAIALAKLPADVITSYFKAVGAVFSSFSSTDKSEIEALNQSLALEVAKKKYEACIEAIKINNEELIESLGCKK